MGFFSHTSLWNVRHGKGLLGIVTVFHHLGWAMLWDWFFEHHHLWWQHWFCEVAVIILIYRGATQLWSLFKVLEIVSSRENSSSSCFCFCFFNHLMNLVKFSSQLKNKLLQKFPIWVLESERMDRSVKNRVRVVPAMKPREETNICEPDALWRPTNNSQWCLNSVWEWRVCGVGGIDLLIANGASLVAQRVKHLPARQETWVWSLGWEDPLEKEMATHSSILAWRIPWTEEPGGLQSTGLQRVGHDRETSLTHSLSGLMGLPW